MDETTKAKLKLWQDKLEKLKIDYDGVMQKPGEAIQQGALRENAAYQVLTEDADAYRARITDVEKIISDIEEGAGVNRQLKKGGQS